MLHSFVQLADLHLHRPHHLVHPVGLNERVLDLELLVLDRFGLERDALGEGIERHQTLFCVLTQLLELRERSELLFHDLDCRHRGGGVFARQPRGLAQPGTVLRQAARHLVDVLELALERAGVVDRLLDLGLRRAQLTAQPLELRVLRSQSVEGRVCLSRLRRKLLDRLAMLCELAIGGHRRRDALLRLPGGVFETLDLPLELFKLAGAAVERREPLADILERRRQVGHLFDDVIE